MTVCHIGRWCDIIVLNVHASTEDKRDDMKESFYEELERVFDHFPREGRYDGVSRSFRTGRMERELQMV
jgi:hypothetical protein